MKQIEDNYNKFINNDIASFSRDINVLRYLKRYQNCPRLIQQSVAQHSWYVSIFVLKLRQYYKFDLQIALKTALVHDIMQSKISDIPHNIKQANPQLSKILQQTQNKVTKKILSQQAYLLMNNFNKGLTTQGLICQLADVLSVILYAQSQIKAGNSTFNYIGIKSINRCKQIVKKLQKYIKNEYTNQQIMNKINQIINIY